MKNNHDYNKYKSRYLTIKNNLNRIHPLTIDVYNDTFYIVKELGKGFRGIVYLAKNADGVHVALKIEKLLPHDVKKSLMSFYWREIEFATTMNRLYPDQFMKLYKYDIKKECPAQINDHIKEVLKLRSTDAQKGFLKLLNSPFCSIKAWSLVDLTLKELFNQWSFDNFKPDVFYDLFIQIVHTIHLINKHGYYHRDFHTKNIGLVKTKENFIDVLGSKILTHGYHIIPLDYGKVINWKYPLRPQEKEDLENENDLMILFRHTLINFDKFNLLNGITQDDHYGAKIKIPDDIRNELAGYLTNLKVNENIQYKCIKVLYKMLYYEDYERQLMGGKLKVIEAPLLLIPENAIVYLISNFKDPEKVLRYLLDNR